MRISLSEYLTECYCTNIQDVEVELNILGSKKLTYIGATYEQCGQKRIYVLGKRYIRPHCYRMNGQTWYIASYLDYDKYQKNSILKDRFSKIHPFGPFFLIFPCDSSEPIDKHETVKYDVVEMTVKPIY